MALVGGQGKAVKLFEFFDCLQGFRRKRSFVFKGVQDDSFEQVSQRQVP